MSEAELVKKYEKFGKYLSIDDIRHVIIIELVKKREVANLSYCEIARYLDSLEFKLNKENIYKYIDDNINVRDENDVLSYNMEYVLVDHLKNRAYEKTLYYNRYLKTLREKIVSMLDLVNIVDRFHKNESISDEDMILLEKLDFEITEDGVLIDDAMRLIRAIVYDIFLMVDVAKESNDYNTYMNMKKVNVYNDDVYPSSDLFLDNVYDEADTTSIVLSDRKKKEKEKDTLEYINDFTKVLKKTVFE